MTEPEVASSDATNIQTSFKVALVKILVLVVEAKSHNG